MSNLKFILLTALTLISSSLMANENQELIKLVEARENAFANSMAQRDFKSFGRFISKQAVFYGSKDVARGKTAVLKKWKTFFATDAAPFSWRAENVDVIADGTLAHSSGPVFDAAGNKIAIFNSTWRLEKDGQWRVVFDKGCNQAAAQ